MCVIIQVNANVKLENDILQRCYDRNNDGWGIMYPDPISEKVVNIKSLGTFAEFLETWESVPTNVNRALHFRIKTHGPINIANCHPFIITDNVSMMHNGIIHTNMVEPERSDSYNFAEYMLKPLLEHSPTLFYSTHFVTLVEAMTKNSRLLFMDTFGNIIRTAEKEWTKSHDCFFSNSYSIDEPIAYSTGHTIASFHPFKKKSTETYQSSVGSYEKRKRQAEHYSDLLPYGVQDEGNTDLYGNISLQEEDEYNKSLSADDLACLPYEDVLDWVSDYPAEATDMLLGLITLISGHNKGNTNVK